MSSAISFTVCGFPSLWTHCFRSRSAGLTAPSWNPRLRPGLQVSPKGQMVSLAAGGRAGPERTAF